MLISASRRTDIPTYYSEWFMNRVRAGFVCARNPMNARQVSRISLLPEAVDGIVFWTKNPLPMLEKLGELDARGYMYCFQFTLTGYGPDVERGVPDKDALIVPAFQRLSDRIGPARVIWRYDPIFLSEKYTEEFHAHRFEALSRRLAPYARRCTISFLDSYRNTARNLAPLNPSPFPEEAQLRVAGRLAEIARGFGLRMDACAEALDLSSCGIGRARCVDGELFEALLGRRLNLKRDRNQRAECGCAQSVDIGAYNSCGNGCRYCYANFNEGVVRANMASHDPNSPLLLGAPRPQDRLIERKP